MGLLKKLQEANTDAESQVEPDGIDNLPPDGEKQAAKPTSPSKTFPRATKPKSEAETQEQDRDDLKLPPELYILQQLLRSHDWHHSFSDDPSQRSAGRVEWTVIQSQVVSAFAAGHAAEVEKMWLKYAPPEIPLSTATARYEEQIKRMNTAAGSKPEENTEHPQQQNNPGAAIAVRAAPAEQLRPYLKNYDPTEDVIDVDTREIPDQAFSDGFRRPDWAKRPQLVKENPGVQNPPAEPVQQGQAAAGGTDILSKMLSAPFALTAAAGSLALNSLKAAGQHAKSYYAKSKINGHVILGQQLDSKASEIGALASSLRKAGMGQLIDDMRLTGRPVREILSSMQDGGMHKSFLDRFDALMLKPGFAADYAKLQAAVGDFGAKAARYAKSGVELDMDFSTVIDRNLEKISAFTEGFISKKDGAIEHLQEIAREIGERIAAMVNAMMGRLAPG